MVARRGLSRLASPSLPRRLCVAEALEILPIALENQRRQVRIEPGRIGAVVRGQSGAVDRLAFQPRNYVGRETKPAGHRRHIGPEALYPDRKSTRLNSSH